MNLNFGKNFNHTENHPRPIIQTFRLTQKSYNRSRHPEMFLRKDVLKICSKLTREHQSMSKLLCNFIEIALRHGCSPLNLLHIFRIPFPKNTAVWLLLLQDLSKLRLKSKLRLCRRTTRIKLTNYN